MNIRVLMFSYYFPPHYSGAALQAISLAKKLRDRGVDVTFLTVNQDALPEVDSVDGFTFYRLKEGRGRFTAPLLWKNMWKAASNGNGGFDILHAHGAYLKNSFFGPLSRMSGKKSLVKVSLADNDLHGLGKGKSGWLHKRFISMVDRYVSISREIAEELKGYGFSDDKIREIPNGVDTDRFSPVDENSRKALREKTGLPAEGLMVLYVGGISSRKNVKWLVDRWTEMCTGFPGFLTVVGPVAREDKDKRLFNSLKEQEAGSKGRLFVKNYTERVEDLYRMADIFVLPSKNEGMPNVVLEAMSTGLACLVNRISGASDLIGGGSGVLMDANEPVTLLDGLNRLRDGKERTEIGKKARERIISDFSLDSVADRYIKLYGEMLGR